MNLKIGFVLTLIFTCSSCASSQIGARKPSSDGRAGTNGAAGATGSPGASGDVHLSGMKCVVSTNLEHLQMCLDDGHSVNVRLHSGSTIFQAALESRDIPMLMLIVNNPDPKNKPDLRVKYTDVKVGTPALNIYDFLLLERQTKNQNWEPLDIDYDSLKDDLYVDASQVERLKIILSIETNRSALEQETRQILTSLKASKRKDLPSMQEAIALLTHALK